MKLSENQPVGIFDSGVGGLTVANAVRNILPNEQIIYFGDTAHLPYGDKSENSIIEYSERISNFLISKNCKVILIACNTASAVAYEHLKTYLGNKILLLDVISPVAEYVAKNDNFNKIGVIGTKNTINSNCYLRQISELDNHKQIVQHATPLLASMIEEGFVYDDISNAIIRSYLSDKKLENIDSLILACTHYPIIKNQIRKYYDFKTTIIDSSVVVAKKLKEILIKHDIQSKLESPEHRFYVSDYTEFFKTIAEIFFEEKINLSQIKV